MRECIRIVFSSTSAIGAYCTTDKKKYKQWSTKHYTENKDGRVCSCCSSNARHGTVKTTRTSSDMEIVLGTSMH